jgi:putative RNA 2'-phosphotransferase
MSPVVILNIYKNNMHTQESKAVSYILRHGAEKIGIKISAEGWVRVASVITEVRKKFPYFTQATLEQIVREDEKGRYSFNLAMDEIRANQGHSLDSVKIEFEKKIPPVKLFHGTGLKAYEEIRKTGIQKMNRHHVHLTDDVETAASVGIRHGAQIIIEVNVPKMVSDGIDFYVSENGVWLTDFVDPKYFVTVSGKQNEKISNS